jgi:methylated-DNA-[protein]-cysteine S-methyltransferase
MLKDTAGVVDAPAEPRPDATRFLFPSPIGDIGIELVDEVVTAVEIRPEKKRRKYYVSFLDLEPTDFLEEVFGRLSEYFAGARRELDLEFDVAATGMTGVQRKILKETLKIPYGKTRTYGRIAEKVGRPDAYRVVLSTLVINPLPLFIPCHRVVTNKSGIGSYVGGKDSKRWLIKMEKAALKEGV